MAFDLFLNPSDLDLHLSRRHALERKDSRFEQRVLVGCLAEAVQLILLEVELSQNCLLLAFEPQSVAL